jgi:uncharacterized protein
MRGDAMIEPPEPEPESEPETERALGRLEEVLRTFGPTVVAFSGGVDSTLVAVVARRVLGPRMLAVTGVSASLAESDRLDAIALAAELELPHRLVETQELARADYRRNAGDRCYHCKTELFERLVELAEREGYETIASGDNLDDLGDHRPGLEAARRLAVRKPLVEAEIGKETIRTIARRLGLSNAERPAAPCLASRVPHGTPVDAEVLGLIERAEAGVRALGFERFRVRHHGDLARLEVPAAAMPAVMECRAQLVAAIKHAGYVFVALDMAGFASGSLNVVLADGRPAR